MIAVRHGLVTIDTFVDITCVLAIRAHGQPAYPSRKTPAIRSRIFVVIPDHKLYLQECAAMDHAGRIRELIQGHFGKNCPLGPGVGMAVPNGLRSDSIPKD